MAAQIPGGGSKEDPMCSYCGCEAEPVIESLMQDHAVISHLAYRVGRALDSGDPDRVVTLTDQLAGEFAVHSLGEEAGLFAEMRAAGEAEAEISRLVADHVRLRAALADPGVTSRPDALRAVLGELTEHAETEDDDLFPFALQVLPAAAWDRINQSAAAVPTHPWS